MIKIFRTILNVFLFAAILVLPGGCVHSGKTGALNSANKASSHDMVLIPGGSFWIGCVPGDKDCDKKEQPRKRIQIDSFWMDVAEVTQAEFKELMGKNPSKNQVCLDCPVENVTWFEAKKYCEKLGKRLPTEAEYERALRGGVEGEIYPWGNNALPPEKYGNYYDERGYERKRKFRRNPLKGYNDGYVQTSPVCSMTKNPYGLCDISGNVAEWCEDFYAADWYLNMPLENPVNRKETTLKVIRGGSWLYEADTTRCSHRGNFFPGRRHFSIGFRCVRGGTGNDY